MNGLTLVMPIAGGRAIWHVSLGSLDQQSGQRHASLSGAWTDDGTRDLDAFAYNRILLEGSDVEAALSSLKAEIATTRTSLQAEFDRYVTASKKDLVPPPWPDVPELDSTLPALYGTPQKLQGSLAYALWARKLIATWAEIEGQRIAKKYLVHLGGDTARDFPPVWLDKRGR